MLEVRRLERSDQKAWDDYVLAHPAATVFHRPAWSEAVAEVYGHTPEHLAAWRGDAIAGVLPLMAVRSLFVGRVLVSVPYATYGGVVADDAEATEALADAALELGRHRGVNYVELRHREARGLPWPEIGHYDTFRKQLPETPDGVLAGLPRKTRTAVRKGLRELGEAAVDIGPDGLDEVYRLYAVTLRRLGSPNYRLELFRALARRYGDACVNLVVRDGARPVAGVVSFIFRDEIVPYFSGSLADGMAMRANNVMYCRLMEWAVEHGLRWFDFNRTRRDNRGPYDFKRHHGFEPAPLAYQAHLVRGRELPNLSPSNSRFALAVRLWRRLPLAVTRPAGARITKWIP